MTSAENMSQTAKVTDVYPMLLDGAMLFLHKGITIKHEGETQILGLNTPLTPDIVEILAKRFGQEYELEFGFQPLPEDELSAGVKTRGSVVKILLVQLRDEAKKEASPLFANRTSLMLGGKEMESFFDTEPTTKSEKFFLSRLDKLKQVKAGSITGTLFSRMVLDTLCTLLLEYLNPNQPPMSEDETDQRYQSILIASMLKDYAPAAAGAAQCAKLLQHPQHAVMSARQLSGSSMDIDMDDLTGAKVDLTNQPPVLASALRMIQEHSNRITKSRNAQIILKGELFCSWLLSRKSRGGNLPNDVLAKLSFLHPVEVPYFLDIAEIAQNPKAQALMATQRKHKGAMRVALFHRQLKNNGVAFPIADGEELKAQLQIFLQQFPDANAITSLPLQMLIALDNELAQLGASDDDRKLHVTHLENHINNLIL